MIAVRIANVVRPSKADVTLPRAIRLASSCCTGIRGLANRFLGLDEEASDRTPKQTGIVPWNWADAGSVVDWGKVMASRRLWRS
jgi:hypothetical protein